MNYYPHKDNWKVQVKRIEVFHLNKLDEVRHWSIHKTAKELNRSVGSVSEDLRLSLALRIYPEVSEFRSKESAMDYLRKRNKCKFYLCNQWSSEQRKNIVQSLIYELEG